MAVAGAVGAVGALAPAASAAGGPVTCGDLISSPGTYGLAADCNGSGIAITSSNVTLMLRGHTMTGSGFGEGIVVADNGGAISGVRITGPGTVAGYEFAVDLGFSGGHGVSGSVIGRVTTTSSRQGITLSNANGSGNTIVGNTANGNSVAGIGDFGTGNTFTQNTVNNNAVYGIDVFGTGEKIRGNKAQGNPTDDLRDENSGCDSNTWLNNTFTIANLGCIH
jgi:parallel beta-helix repeat protein